MKFHACLLLLPLAAAVPAQQPGASASPVPPALWDPSPAGRVYDVRQIVTLSDVPADAKKIRMWVAIPAETVGQEILDFKVVDAPGTRRVVRQPETASEFLYVETDNPGTGKVVVTVDVALRRQARTFKLDPAKSGPITADHRLRFADDLKGDVPLMTVDAESQKLAAQICGGETNTIAQAKALWQYVADYADHYSKDASKPKCGRGAAEDCMAQKGGCCTDLHSLYIQLLRSRGIPARLEFGYRMQAKNDGVETDPGYRCWVEWFAPGYGWVPTDIVAGDAGDAAVRELWFNGVDDRRLWCNRGRNFDLEPRQSGDRKINTMIIGHAEIDGRWVNVLPDAAGKPSPLTRKIVSKERKTSETAAR
ncbi:MAG TPA: transglutaminase domain-containing protein [Planctomycetota bacterium]|nr:transglutaminase domain-containing protein [Planctomycetota bacterium]